MSHEPSYCIVLLPSREIVRRAYSLREAAAWLATYNAIMGGAGTRAAIVEEWGEGRMVGSSEGPRMEVGGWRE
jgi:hypothetical protein